MTEKKNGFLKSGDPGENWQGKASRTLKDSTPWWREPVKAPQGAPNVVVILLDDLGFSDLGCYGGEIRTPAMDKIAEQGLRYTGYTTVPMCTPARAALLTGKNPHSVGCGWLTHANPGYPGYQAGEMSPDAPTMPELLRQRGYSTYAVGKWHNTADYHVGAGVDRSSWPLQKGFDRFYGFLGAETNYHSPGELVEGNQFVSPDCYPDDYFCTDDWTDKAVSWLRSHQSSCPDKPFFLYYASNAPHVPLHAKAQDLAKYKGRYQKGWDTLRASRFERQKELGLIGKEWDLSTRSPGVPQWDEIPEEKRDIYAAYMELYAALVDNTDQNIGRLMAELDALGVADNTLVIVTSDNGASSIGGEDGAANIYMKRLTHNEGQSVPRKLMESGRLGSVETGPAYPAGWGNACNTPFRFYKRTPMNGGIRVPFLVRWGERIKDAGAMRRQWIHVTDVLPTLLDLADQEYPQQFNGYQTRGLNGAPFTESLFDENAGATRTGQHYELEGNRGYIDGDWKVCSLQPPGTDLDLDNWLLFNLKDDPTECHDLAGTHPDVLRRLVEKFEADAQANYVYPLDNRDLRRATSVPPFLEDTINQSRIYYPGTETVHALEVTRLLADRDYRLVCSFDWRNGNDGVLFAIGDATGGLTAWVDNGLCYFAWRGGVDTKRIVEFPLNEGSQWLEIIHSAEGQRRGHGKITLESEGGTASTSQEVDMSPTLLRLNGEGLDVGLDRRLKVVPECEGRGAFRYGGRIDWLRVEPGKQAPGSIMNRAERIAQIDW